MMTRTFAAYLCLAASVVAQGAAKPAHGLAKEPLNTVLCDHRERLFSMPAAECRSDLDSPFQRSADEDEAVRTDK